MNKLEEQMEQTWQKNCKLGPVNPMPYNLGFKACLNLELPVKFAEWMDRCVTQFGLDIYRHEGKSYESIAQLYQFWIENIYGRL